MDGTHITNIRTGAQTAASLSYLIKKPSITVGIYGAGTQARMNTLALNEIYNIKKLTIWNHRRSTAEKFVKDMENPISTEIKIADDQKEASQSDVVITVTSAQEPLVKNEWIQPDTIVYPLGSFQEIDDDLILNADKIIVDHPYQALNRGALKKLHHQGKITEDTFYATLGEFANEKISMDDTSNEVVICIPIGMGSVDVAIAHEVYERALEKGHHEWFDFKA
jgi:ornithine cyclodeaminase/alanine dehydrogenase